MNRTRLVALGVLNVAIACLVVMWSFFATMYLEGKTEILVQADRFNEFAVEIVLLTLAMIFLPVLVVELDELLEDN